MKRYDLENYEDQLSIMDVAPDGDWVDYDEAVDAIQQARREGWEQAKREATTITSRANNRDFYMCQKEVRDAIAAMEYKEKANDCTRI